MVRKRKEKPMVFIERTMSEGGARTMIKYLTEKLGYKVIGVQTPKEGEEHWYVISYVKEHEEQK